MKSQAAVFVFAHPDDEFGVFAEIEDTVARGGRPLCVYLTDGAFGGQSAARRRDESLHGLSQLGVAQTDVHFTGEALGIGDGELPQRAADAVEPLRAILRAASPIGALFVPAWEGGHQDHDAAHVVGLVALRRDALDLEPLQFALYTGYRRRGSLFRVLTPLPANGPITGRRLRLAERIRYLRYCTSYPSQWKSWVGLFPFVLLRYITLGRQELQVVSATRLTEPPHDGAPLYERRGFYRWKDFAEQTLTLRREAHEVSPGTSLRTE